MEVTADHLGAVQFEIKARQHSIACDQPAENGGYDEGMTPPELFLASLGSCAAFYAADYLKRNHLASEGTRVRITCDKVKPPVRLDNFQIEVDVPVDLTDEQRKGVDEAVHRCLIHNTLLHPPRWTLKLRQQCWLSQRDFTFSRSLAASSGCCGSVMRAGSKISLICSSLR